MDLGVMFFFEESIATELDLTDAACCSTSVSTKTTLWCHPARA